MVGAQPGQVPLTSACPHRRCVSGRVDGEPHEKPVSETAVQHRSSESSIDPGAGATSERASYGPRSGDGQIPGDHLRSALPGGSRPSVCPTKTGSGCWRSGVAPPLTPGEIGFRPMMRDVGRERAEPTIGDVARAAGVSRATVSRVLNDHPRVDRELA
ncbi:MAG TPA: LacI family DNA-binding transcriptional regulator, partial [Actinoallomurus sp.]|nr:LacI family DNA-binding transcriptional regulator [Actinoallomurus sp.]